MNKSAHNLHKSKHSTDEKQVRTTSMPEDMQVQWRQEMYPLSNSAIKPHESHSSSIHGLQLWSVVCVCMCIRT